MNIASLEGAGFISGLEKEREEEKERKISDPSVRMATLEKTLRSLLIKYNSFSIQGYIVLW